MTTRVAGFVEKRRPLDNVADILLVYNHLKILSNKTFGFQFCTWVMKFSQWTKLKLIPLLVERQVYIQ